MQGPCNTNRKGTKESGGCGRAFAFPALDDIDGMEVVSKDDDGPGPSADELAEHISGHLPPWETPKDSHA